MKIIQVIGSLTGRGAERVCVELHEKFLALGHQSVIYITHPVVEYEVAENCVRYLPPEKVVDQIKSEKFDLLFGHMTHAAKVLRSLKKDPRVFLLIHTTLSAKLARMPLLKRVEEFIKLQIIYRKSNVICVSKWVQNDLEKKLKIHPQTLRTIYNPFDFDHIRKMSMEKCDLPYEFIVSVGSLEQVKRYDILLEAYALLKSEKHLVLLGKGQEMDNLKNIAKKLGVEHKVHFLGWDPNPYKYIKKAKLFVLSSDIEGLPSVVIESLIIGTPVVSTDCPSGIREIMSGELSLHLSLVGDPVDLYTKMQQALSFYPKIDKGMLKKFDASKVVNKYLKKEIHHEI